MTQSVIEGKNQKTNMSVCDIPLYITEFIPTINVPYLIKKFVSLKIYSYVIFTTSIQYLSIFEAKNKLVLA